MAWIVKVKVARGFHYKVGWRDPSGKQKYKTCGVTTWVGWPFTSGRGSWRSRTAGSVLVSSTVKDLLAGSGIGFEDRGGSELRGVPGTWRVFAAAPG